MANNDIKIITSKESYCISLDNDISYASLLEKIKQLNIDNIDDYILKFQQNQVFPIIDDNDLNWFMKGNTREIFLHQIKFNDIKPLIPYPKSSNHFGESQLINNNNQSEDNDTIAKYKAETNKLLDRIQLLEKENETVVKQNKQLEAEIKIALAAVQQNKELIERCKGDKDLMLINKDLLKEKDNLLLQLNTLQTKQRDKIDMSYVLEAFGVEYTKLKLQSKKEILSRSKSHISQPIKDTTESNPNTVIKILLEKIKEFVNDQNTFYSKMNQLNPMLLQTHIPNTIINPLCLNCSKDMINMRYQCMSCSEYIICENCFDTHIDNSYNYQNEPAIHPHLTFIAIEDSIKNINIDEGSLKKDDKTCLNIHHTNEEDNRNDIL